MPSSMSTCRRKTDVAVRSTARHYLVEADAERIDVCFLSATSDDRRRKQTAAVGDRGAVSSQTGNQVRLLLLLVPLVRAMRRRMTAAMRARDDLDQAAVGRRAVGRQTARGRGRGRVAQQLGSRPEQICRCIFNTSERNNNKCQVAPPTLDMAA